MATDDSIRPGQERFKPRLYSFNVRLDGEKWSFPCSVFSVGERQAKEVLNKRFAGRIAECNCLGSKISSMLDNDDNKAASDLIHRLSTLLNGICDALKGKTPAVMHSWHDLPEVALAQHQALQNIMQILGPEPGGCSDCQGCSAEINMALDELKKVGIEYKGRKRTSP